MISIRLEDGGFEFFFDPNQYPNNLIPSSLFSSIPMNIADFLRP